MAKFVFKLEAVLRQRKLAEREKQRELASCQKVLADLSDALRDLNDRARATSDDLRKNHLVGKLDMNFLTAHRRYMLAAQRQATAIIQQIALAQRGADETRAALLDAARQRKIIEKLREKQLARWQVDVHRREAHAADEINVQLAYQEIVAQQLDISP